MLSEKITCMLYLDGELFQRSKIKKIMLIFMPRKVHRTTRNMSFVNILAEDRYDEGMITIKHKFCGVPNK